MTALPTICTATQPLTTATTAKPAHRAARPGTRADQGIPLSVPWHRARIGTTGAATAPRVAQVLVVEDDPAHPHRRPAGPR